MATVVIDPAAIKTDEDHIECYRTVGRRCHLSNGWKVMIRGRVVQARPDNLRRKLLMRLLCQAMKPTPSELNSPVFRERIESFLVLSCPKTRVSMQVGDRMHTLKKRSKSNGMFQQVVNVPTTDVERLQILPGGRQLMRLAPVIRGAGEKDQISHRIAQAQLISPVGVSVISDIDDTVKVTRVGNRREMLANTFINEFRCVDGIRAAYRRWEDQGAAFHYVSSSPWQLHRPLSEFMDRESIPQGSLHLRTVKLQGPSLLRLLTGGKRSKKKAIRSLLAWYPGRQFILVGDAGEKDPEIYGAIARKHPVQVAGIFIRRLDTANMSDERFQKAFRGVPQPLWRVFEDPEELGVARTVMRDGQLRWNT